VRAVFPELLLDDARGLFAGVVAGGGGAPQEFTLEFGGKLVQKDGFFLVIGMLQRTHECIRNLILKAAGADNFLRTCIDGHFTETSWKPLARFNL